MKRLRPAGALLGLLGIFGLLSACRHEAAHREWGAMSSNFAASLRDSLPGAVPATAALDSIEADSRRWDSLFSDYSQISGIARLRGRRGDTVAISPDVEAVLTKALEIGALTSGSFDLGMHDAKALWDLTNPEPHLPASAALAGALARRWPQGIPPAGTFMAPLRILPGHRAELLVDSLPIDLGGIAKGYAVDRMSEHLTAMGWPVHLIQGGGEIRCSGRKSGGWRIGVKDPRRPDAVAASLRLDSGRAVSTSGDYERFFLRNGVRYHHIMDPRTAAPARGGSVATTVLCAKSVACDALSTALFVLGPRRGKTAAQRAGVEAFWIRETPEGLCGLATAGWGTRLSLAKGLATCREPW